ncbi:MAG: DinB family protein [Acidobacteriota bacterium]
MRAIRQLGDIRRLVGKLVSSVAPEDLSRVPPGFVNHIAWNAAHIVVTQQILHYRLSGLDPHVPAELIAKYQKGTGPEAGDEDSYRRVMEFLHRGPDLLGADFENGRFESFNAYNTSAGIQLDKIEDAIVFNNFHEGIHVGYIMALRKALA